MITSAHAPTVQTTNPVLSAILTKAVKDKRGSFVAVARTLADAGMRVHEKTVSKWCQHGIRLFPARAAWALSFNHGLGGLSFALSPLPFNADFEYLWRMLSRKTDELGMTDIALAQVLGVTNGHYAKMYRRDYRYARDNLTLRMLDAWAHIVGFGCAVLPERPANMGRDNDSPASQAPLAPAVPTFQTFPAEHELHLPLVQLLKVLKAERLMQRREHSDFQKLADSKTIDSWERGKLLFARKEAARDLTLGRLDEWSRALGFGGVVSPQLGALGWDEVVPELLRRVELSDPYPRAMLKKRNVAVMWGASWRKLVATPWQDLPAVYFEYLSVWAYDQGLAFVGDTGKSGRCMGTYGLVPLAAQPLYAKAGEKLRNDVANRGVNDRPMKLRDEMSTGIALYSVVAPVDFPRKNTC